MGWLVRNGHRGSKDRSVKCVRREKRTPEAREPRGQEEDTGVNRRVLGTGVGGEWSEGLQASKRPLHLFLRQ